MKMTKKRVNTGKEKKKSKQKPIVQRTQMKIKKSKQPRINDKCSGKVAKTLSKVTTDEFFDQNFDAADSDDDSIGQVVSDESDSEDDLNPTSHKESLNKLKETDPDFYNYLQQNDKKLLNFDEEEDSDGGDDNLHIPDNNLEVASDESDLEDGENGSSSLEKGGPNKVSLKLLKSWQENLQKDKSAKTIRCVVETFHAALLTVSEADSGKASSYRVEGGPVFNGVVQLCVLHLPAAIKEFLKINNDLKVELHKQKRFPKIKSTLKSYLSDLLKILTSVSSPDILIVLLKHLHQMIPYAQCFSSLDKPLLKILLKLWSTGEETVRVLAFLSIIKIATTRKDPLLNTLFKSMYIKYVQNAKFVSENTLPGINFMRHSLAEIYMLDPGLAYNHAFLYIRQLAIHLRNAMTLKKKENFQSVYNWQYINSLNFWTDLITLSRPQSMLRSLLFPLVQIITGTIKLIPTSQYYPLRFHCVKMLINISSKTGTFIPILPFLLEVLNDYDFNKKHKNVTMKPISFTCLLRMAKSQLLENGFKDSIIENIYELILEIAAKESHTIYFPDLYVSCCTQLKSFLKKCKVANFCKKIKQLLEKIQENREAVENERNKSIIDLSDTVEVKNWESKLKSQGTPLATFYDSWSKFHHAQKMKMITKNDEIAGYNIKSVRSLTNKKKRRIDVEDDDSDLDMPVEKMEEMLKKQKSRKSKKKKLSYVEQEGECVESIDVIKDTNVKDWE